MGGGIEGDGGWWGGHGQRMPGIGEEGKEPVR
jgi:hypothetical protein